MATQEQSFDGVRPLCQYGESTQCKVGADVVGSDVGKGADVGAITGMAVVGGCVGTPLGTQKPQVILQASCTWTPEMLYAPLPLQRP